MNSVITEEQARAITGGRKPLVPLEYEAACRSLTECLTLDEAKYWNDRSDALAAWAKIYRDDLAGLEAKKLKLHAYRRMGQIAMELRPQEQSRRSDGKIMGKKDGPASLLREKGIDRGHEFAATKLARLTDSEFGLLTDRPRVPSPLAALRSAKPDIGQIVASAYSFRAACRKVAPDDIAAELTTQPQRALFREILEWCDRMDQCFEHDRPE